MQRRISAYRVAPGATPTRKRKDGLWNPSSGQTFPFGIRQLDAFYARARQGCVLAIRSSDLRFGAARLAHTVTRADISPREAALIERYGEVCTLDEVAAILKYPSGVAVRRAHALKRLPLPLTRFTGRRGLFALTRDIARLLDAQERPFALQSAPEVRE